jgi:hypothetical protein
VDNKEQMNHKYDKDALAQLQATAYSADSKTMQRPLAASQVYEITSGKRWMSKVGGRVRGHEGNKGCESGNSVNV